MTPLYTKSVVLTRRKIVDISRRLKRRSFSSPTKKDGVADEISASARDMSILFETEKSKAIEISKLLSQSARKELSQIRTSMCHKVSSNGTAEAVSEPSRRDLNIHALTCGIPFIGFGIMDNAILIWAGDKIDTHLGVVFGISTLCAAAIGNIISDIAGVGLGAYIEDFCTTKLRLPKVNLTNAQRNLRSVRFAGQLGNMIGLTIGCIIGMFPLLFIDTEEVQHMKNDARMDEIFMDVVTEAKGLIGAESTCLYLIVDDKKTHSPTPFSPGLDDKNGRFLYAKYATEEIDSIERSIFMKKPISHGIIGRAASSGEVTIVPNVNSDPDYDPLLTSIHMTEHNDVKNMLCVPVFDVNGSVIAVIQAINKVEEGAVKSSNYRSSTKSIGFTLNDAKVLKSLASHISVSLQNMHREQDTSLKEIVKILKDHAAA